MCEQMIKQTPIELANEVCMMNAGANKFIIVEGNTDRKFWNLLQANNDSRYVIYLGAKIDSNSNKDYVIRVLNILHERGQSENTFGIIDPDYEFINGKSHNLKNLYYYKYKDLEITLLKSHSLNKVNGIVSSLKKKKPTQALLELILSKSYPLGLLRLINDMHSCNFKFTELKLKKLFGSDENSFLKYFQDHLKISVEEMKILQERYTECNEKKYKKEYICNGHDALEIFSLLLKRDIATENPIVHTAEILGELLMSSYHHEQSSGGYIDIEAFDDIVMPSIKGQEPDLLAV